MSEVRLSECALIVQLNLSAWEGRRLDKRLGEEAEAKHGTGRGTVKAQKLLVPEEVLKPIQQAQRKARDRHCAMTSPWGENAARIVTAEIYMDYMAAMDEERTACERAYDAFAAAYPRLLEDAPARMNGLYRKADFPPAAEMRGRFGFRLDVLTVPDQGDFRLNLRGALDAAQMREIEARLKAQVGENVRARARDAELSIWERLDEVVRKFRETVMRPKPRIDSLVSAAGNMLEFARIAPKLSLSGGAGLRESCARVAAIKPVPATLRNSRPARKRAAEAAAEALAAVERAKREVAA